MKHHIRDRRMEWALLTVGYFTSGRDPRYLVIASVALVAYLGAWVPGFRRKRPHS